MANDRDGLTSSCRGAPTASEGTRIEEDIQFNICQDSEDEVDTEVKIDTDCLCCGNCQCAEDDEAVFIEVLDGGKLPRVIPSFKRMEERIRRR